MPVWGLEDDVQGCENQGYLLGCKITKYGLACQLHLVSLGPHAGRAEGLHGPHIIS